MATDKKTEEDKKQAKKVEAKVSSPKGPLPRKQKRKTTTGKAAYDERYCPSKRIKTMHRKSGDLYTGDKALSLKTFANKVGAEGLNDWLANKSASGRGY